MPPRMRDPSPEEIEQRAAEVRARWPDWRREQHATSRTAGWRTPTIRTADVVAIFADVFEGERLAAH